MFYHSEPITRQLVGNWHTSQARKISKRADIEDENGNPTTPEQYVAGFVNEWEKISQADATNEEREKYFAITIPTLSMFGMIAFLSFMFISVVSMNLDFLAIGSRYC